uniref:Uncharacterized protein n=1 Tax=Moumouvirus australiensis transpoviron TaxID=2711276 RepID=A0A2P1EHH3_9VIRU|nr:hypothetical protein matv_3 [Moumouvirus australiensis transpoviron]
MDDIKQYLIIHDALNSTNNNLTSKYNIYILLIIILLLLILVGYLIKKISDLSSEKNTNNNIPQRHNINHPLLCYNPPQLQTYNPPQLQTYNPPQLQNYIHPQLQTYNPPQLQFNHSGSNYNSRNTPIIEEIY